LALCPKAICALDSASQLPASASGPAKVRGDRASHTDTAADEVLMRDTALKLFVEQASAYDWPAAE
jgi:hypothetical protein